MGGFLARIGVTPNWLTFFGLLLNIPTAILIGSGRVFTAFWLLAGGGLMDLLDGAVAKARGGGTRRGAFFDSVADRASDALVFGGCAWLLAKDSPFLAVLPLACLATANLTSYTRSKAAEHGFDAHVGIMERAERLILLGLGLLFQTWFSALVPALWVLLALSGVTAVHRFFAVWRQGEAEPPLPIDDVRLLPDLRALRVALNERDDDERATVAVRRAWEEQRSEIAERRAAAAARRRVRRLAEVELRARLRADGRPRRAARERTRRP